MNMLSFNQWKKMKGVNGYARPRKNHDTINVNPNVIKAIATKSNAAITS